MKKWQKITGLIALSLIAIYELLTWANIYIEALSFGMWMNLALAVFLFIYLWRKSMTKTCSSPIKTISDEKTTIPFTFERAYCRIGVATDNSGIERMEVYFVRNDKTAICYRNCSFNQVVIDDAKLDKYDSLEIRGDIISIRATTGLANYIIKLSDERLIVFEVLPKGYGELYENITIIVPSANEYSDYLEDYKQGIEFDS